jgi:hypothetical protein
MEIIIAIAVVVIVGGYFIYKRADKNGDGRVDAVEAKAAVEEVKEEVKVVVQEAKTQVKKAAVKAKANMGAKTRTAVNKASTKKPAAKKPVAKK